MPSTIYIIIAISLILGLLCLWRGFTNSFATDLYKKRGFLQIVLGLIFFAIMGVCLVTKLSLSPYSPMPAGKPIAHITFEVQDPETFTYVATITRYGGIPRRYEISGDQWTMDIRTIQWSKDMNSLGFRNLFQVTGLHSSYSVPRTGHQAEPKHHTFIKHNIFDVKQLYIMLKQHLPFVNVKDTSTVTGPFLDGGQYDIYFDDNGLLQAELVF